MVWAALQRFSRNESLDLRDVIVHPDKKKRLISVRYDTEGEATRAKKWMDTQSELFHIPKASHRHKQPIKSHMLE